MLDLKPVWRVSSTKWTKPMYCEWTTWFQAKGNVKCQTDHLLKNYANTEQLPAKKGLERLPVAAAAAWTAICLARPSPACLPSMMLLFFFYLQKKRKPAPAKKNNNKTWTAPHKIFVFIHQTCSEQSTIYTTTYPIYIHNYIQPMSLLFIYAPNIYSIASHLIYTKNYG